MKINIDMQDNVCIISLNGRLDGTTMHVVEEQFLALISEQHQRFIFDLNELEYISSAGLRVMLLAVKKTRAIEGKIALFGMNSNVNDVFEISGFSTIFPMLASREEALQFVSV